MISSVLFDNPGRETLYVIYTFALLNSWAKVAEIAEKIQISGVCVGIRCRVITRSVGAG